MLSTSNESISIKLGLQKKKRKEIDCITSLEALQLKIDLSKNNFSLLNLDIECSDVKEIYDKCQMMKKKA